MVFRRKGTGIKPPEAHDAAAEHADGDRACPVRLRRGGGSWLRWAPVRWCGIAAGIAGGLAVLGLVGILFLVARLDSGPIELAGLSSRIKSSLDEKFGEGLAVNVGKTALANTEHGPALTIDGLTLRGRDGKTVVAAPRALVSLDPVSLLGGSISLRRLQVVGLDLRISVREDGGLEILAGNKPLVLSGPVAVAQTPVASVQSVPSGHSVAASSGTGKPEAKPETKPGALKPLANAISRLLALSTGPDSALGSLRHLGISRGRLVFEDRSAGIQTVFDGMALDLQRTTGTATLTLSARGPNGIWQVRLSTADAATADDTRDVEIAVNNVTVDELMLLAGIRNPQFDTDMRFSGEFRVGIDKAGDIRKAAGAFTFGKGYFLIRDRDHEPALFDSIAGSLRWDAGRKLVVLDHLHMASGETSFTFGGTIAPPVAGARTWRFALASRPGGHFGPLWPGQKKLPVSRISLAGEWIPDIARLRIDTLSLAGPDVNVLASVISDHGADGRRLRMTVQAENMPVLAAFRLWPTVSAAPLRAWLMKNMTGGRLEKMHTQVDFREPDFAALRALRAPSDDSVKGSFRLSNVRLAVLPGVPPVEGLSVSGNISGQTSRIAFSGGSLSAGRNRRVAINKGTFVSRNQEPVAVPSQARIDLSGSIQDLAALLAKPGLREHAAFELDAARMSGHVEGTLHVKLDLSERAQNDPDRSTVTVKAEGAVSRMRIAGVLGAAAFEKGEMRVRVEGSQVSAEGSGRILGAPASLRIAREDDGVLSGIIKLTLDDAARRRHGWKTGAILTGPVGMEISGPLGQRSGMRGDVELDLTRATIANILPGVVKRKGQKSSASFTVVPGRNGASTLRDFRFEGGNILARGTVELDRNWSLIAARLARLKLSPGDDMNADIRGAGEGLQVRVRGSNMDLRPFLRILSGAAPRSGKPVTASGGLDLDVQSAVVTGHNRRALTNFRLKLARSGGQLQAFDLSARAGRSTVRGRLTGKGNGAARINVVSSDAGTLLAFFDLYSRMENGQLALVADVREGRIDGSLNVTRFFLRNEPALGRLVAQGVQQANGRKPQINTSHVPFDRLKAKFAKTSGQLYLRNAIISGPSIGTTLSGVVDFARDRVDLKGTFVPAYGFNNLFAKIPLFGPILGGGRDEGLLGINFRVSGKASAPYLNINPLSAIAPGFLRKIFGANVTRRRIDPQRAPVPRRNIPRPAAPQARNDSNAPLSLTPRR